MIVQSEFSINPVFFCDHSENDRRKKTDTRETGYLLIFEITSFLHPGGLQPAQQQV